mmetsp:Transcript_111575/g.310705  ORF Transcript_111575/g.310705 Transcript_111575/m.310705 type:complete len:241 (+) Transcript_111575:833-1555(+)
MSPTQPIGATQPRRSKTCIVPSKKPPSGKASMYLWMPPANWKTSVRVPTNFCLSNADARSQRTPPVQYIITRFPWNCCKLSGRSKYPGKSLKNLVEGSTHLTLLSGAAKRPMRVSYKFRQSKRTRSSPPLRRTSCHSSGLRCRPLSADANRRAEAARPSPAPAKRPQTSWLSQTLRPRKVCATLQGASLKSVSASSGKWPRASVAKASQASQGPLRLPLKPSPLTRTRPLSPRPSHTCWS